MSLSRRSCFLSHRPVQQQSRRVSQIKSLHLFGDLAFQSSLAPTMQDSPANIASYANLELHSLVVVHRQAKWPGAPAAVGSDPNIIGRRGNEV
jgi:hypothetical protein